MKQPVDRSHQPPGFQVTAFAEQVSPVDRCQCPAAAQVEIRGDAIVEADGYQPHVVLPPLLQLLDSQQEFAVHVTCQRAALRLEN
jgi:hypothetical protein